ncbi:TIGR02452 family protein [Actinokineospora globicatena]|uniref:TIGR02452 family protein n=1 Tax=Actinokineospora globicatena TaxID=103729 RepID=A0A9W6V826_9PSEU|nr:TIGR02452 family protein [Actinokineospora globicatena]
MARVSSRLRGIARETVEIAERGSYAGPVGDVDIHAAVRHAVAGTRLYLPDEAVPVDAKVGVAEVEVTGESTLAAARRLGGDVAALVFASARNAGGGFLNGAQAQEESLARSSALYPCLRAAGDFYAYHRAHEELVYSDRVIYSPRVPVFRDDKGTFLPAPYPVTFLTASAPNHGAVARTQPHHLAKIPEILTRRAARVLQVAAANNHRRLLLGAWGCGVFANDPATVATAFHTALRENPFFDQVTFAVYDRHPTSPTRTAFTTTFQP